MIGAVRTVELYMIHTYRWVEVKIAHLLHALLIVFLYYGRSCLVEGRSVHSGGVVLHFGVVG
jgi:hypothetical protein